MKRMFLFIVSVALIHIRLYGQPKVVLNNSEAVYTLEDRYLKREVDYMDFWIEKTPREETISSYRRKEILNRKKYNLPIRGYEMYRHTLTHWCVNCSEHKYKLLNSIDYDTKNNELGDFNNSVSDWIDIIPHSLADRVDHFVCEKYWDK